MKNMGLWGENKAVEFLKAKNYTILARNYHSRFGEIDIIARKQNTIIFVEVKKSNRKKLYKVSMFTRVRFVFLGVVLLYSLSFQSVHIQNVPNLA